ncbi:hypothetical protein ACU635_24890 [[Actinomadura] parvosata]|uniref:hypothetical protein n=1 Tax=[Actinomadura] parvosata TaxID=1955412 RepID=UPI00406BEBA7
MDDVQHFDRDSRDVLGFVTRRLAGEAVTVLIAARGQTPPAGLVPDLPLLPLAPLDPAAAARLLDAQPHPPAGRARIDLLAQAAGNPLAIIEPARAHRAGEPLPGSPGAGRNLPGEPSGGALPQTLRIQEMFAARLRALPPAARLRALPPATRRLVLHAAAASEYESLETIMAAATATGPEIVGAGGGLDGWAPPEEAGLVRIAEGRIAFRHPLMRTAAYHAATAHQRQRARRPRGRARRRPGPARPAPGRRLPRAGRVRGGGAGGHGRASHAARRLLRGGPGAGAGRRVQPRARGPGAVIHEGAAGGRQRR